MRLANSLVAAVLVVEAGPDSKDIEAVNVATDRNNITPEECNWKCVYRLGRLK